MRPIYGLVVQEQIDRMDCISEVKIDNGRFIDGIPGRDGILDVKVDDARLLMILKKLMG